MAVKGLTTSTMHVIKKGPWERAANETPREELLQRDVFIQFNEIRSLRAENAALKEELRRIKISNARMDKEYKKLRYENDLLHLSSLHQ